jgi:endoglucanase
MMRLLKASKFAMVAAFIAAISCAAQTGFVHTQGKQLVDGAGKPLLLRGTSFGNWLEPEGYMLKLKDGPQSPATIEALTRTLLGPEESAKFWVEYRKNYITQGDVQFLKKAGFNSVRIPFHYKFFANGSDEGFKLIDPVVAWAHEAGIYVILDMHCAPGGQTGANIDDSDNYPWLYESPSAQKEAVEIWTRIAKHYANNKTVLGYDLLNEPLPGIPTLAHLKPLLEPMFKKLTVAVRSVDKNHVVIITGANWDGDFSVLGAPFDNNAMYTWHRYGITGSKEDVLKPFVAYREKYNVPLWLGESGENADEWVADFRAVLEKNDIGWAFWPYKKMDSGSSEVTFAKPPHWDEIVDYAAHSWMLDEKHSPLRARPTDDVIHAALDGLLTNIQFANEKVNTGYVKALLPDTPVH